MNINKHLLGFLCTRDHFTPLLFLLGTLADTDSVCLTGSLFSNQCMWRRRLYEPSYQEFNLNRLDKSSNYWIPTRQRSHTHGRELRPYTTTIWTDKKWFINRPGSVDQSFGWYYVTLLLIFLSQTSTVPELFDDQWRHQSSDGVQYK